MFFFLVFFFFFFFLMIRYNYSIMRRLYKFTMFTHIIICECIEFGRLGYAFIIP